MYSMSTAIFSNTRTALLRPLTLCDAADFQANSLIRNQIVFQKSNSYQRRLKISYSVYIPRTFLAFCNVKTTWPLRTWPEKYIPYGLLSNLISHSTIVTCCIRNHFLDCAKWPNNDSIEPNQSTYHSIHTSKIRVSYQSRTVSPKTTNEYWTP